MPVCGGGGGDDIDTASCLLTFFDCQICGCNKKRAWHFVGVYISGIIYVRAPSQRLHTNWDIVNPLYVKKESWHNG